MRVLHWYPNLLAGGAVASVTLGLASAQMEAGAEVVVATAETDAAAIYGGVDANAALVAEWRPRWRLSAGGLVLRGLGREDRRRLRSFGPDVVHVHGEFNPDNLWARSLRAPIVLTPHGGFDPVVLEKRKKLAKRAYIALANRMLYQRLAAIHALSPMEAEHVRTVAPGVPVYVLPQGGSPTTVLALARGAERATAPNERVEFLFVGRLDVFTKGLDLLLDAFAATAHASERSMRLTLVGPDWRGGRAFVERRADELGIAELVDLVGPVGPAEVAARLLASDVSAQLSRHEGLSLTATEALLAGKPLVMTTTMGHASYPEVADLPHVFVVPPERAAIGAAFRTLLERLDDARRSASESRPALASLFSWERVARAHLDAYAELIGAA